MPGRKAKPTHLKLLTGNPGKRPLNKREPVPVNDTPQPPDYLSRPARDIFLRLVARLDELGLASASHTEMLTLAALRLEEVERCTEVLNVEGFTVEDELPNGGIVVRRRPEVVIRREAAKHAQSLLAEFGLSPAAATKVVVPKKQPRNAFSDL